MRQWQADLDALRIGAMVGTILCAVPLAWFLTFRGIAFEQTYTIAFVFFGIQLLTWADSEYRWERRRLAIARLRNSR